MNIFLTAQDRLRLQLLKTVIDCDYTSFNYTLHELCKRFKLSDHKLRYGFEEVHGISLVEYQSRKRLTHITELLRKKNISLSAAVYDAGFRDYSTFYRLFKRKFKMPPNTWRKKLAGRRDMETGEKKSS